MADKPNPSPKAGAPKVSPTGTGFKVGGKKIPTMAFIIIAGAVVVGFIAYRKNKATVGSGESEAGELGRQAFIPVTAENVGGVGAGGGGLTSTQAAESGQLLSQEQANNEWLANFLNEQKQENRTFYETISKTLTGGGAPTGTNPGGVVSAPPQNGATEPGKTNPPPHTTPPPSAPVTPKNITCPNGCPGHEYPKGKNGKGTKTVECMVKKSGKCVWP